MKCLELDRQERELRRPPNWGAITYWNLEKRHGKNTKPLAATKNVTSMLELNPVVRGPLDASDVLDVLTEPEQCDFFSRYPKCEKLILRNWKTISDHVLRAISISMGDSLLEIDFSGSDVTLSHFEILLGRINKLRVIRATQCPLLDGASMKLLAQTCNKTLVELYVDGCALFQDEPLLWLAGCVGIGGQKLGNLHTLDLATCPVIDRGLIAIATGCKKLKFLNLEECVEVTDSGVVPVVLANKKLVVLNVCGCSKLTNKTVQALRGCTHLVSLNLARCAKITDKGIIALTKACHELQALNLAGLKSISEAALLSLAENCKGILMLNVTGCEDVTLNGLRALITGLEFVEEARTYTGFKPMDEHIEKKLCAQLVMNRATAAAVIQKNYRAVTSKRGALQIYEIMKIDKAARTLQGAMGRYKYRMKFYRMWQDKLHLSNVLAIQRVWRGYRGRVRAAEMKRQQQEMLTLTPHVLRLQKIFRGHRSRRINKYVAEVIREMYDVRRREAEVGIAVRFQSCGRRFLARRRILAIRELTYRRREDEYSAAVVMQNLVRMYITKVKYKNMRLQNTRVGDMRTRAASRIQAFYRASKGKYNSKLTRQEMLMIARRRLNATMIVQRFMRGHWARQECNKRRIANAVQYFAAREIQRVFRGRRVLPWRDMRLNIIASFVLDRQYIERMDRVAACRMRYKNYLVDIRRDSASESEDEDPEMNMKWTKAFDYKRNKEYWMNIETGDVTYEEPFDELEVKKSLVGARVRVLWVVQGEWFEGTVARYHVRKNRYRIEYDDGDHEWMNLDREKERVQIQLDDGSWTMFLLFQPDSVKAQMEKIAERRRIHEYQEQAYRDAQQWRVVSEDPNEKLMFISDITGVIRTGAPDALQWVIQDDGNGYPCFYNVSTGETDYEDPRFIDDPMSDIAFQREFVMQELRYAMYFCKDLLDKHKMNTYMNNAQKTKHHLKVITRSNKVKLLTAFLIRAKALFKPTSVVDKPIDPMVDQELEYAAWLAAELAALIDEGHVIKREDHKAKKKLLNQVLKVKRPLLEEDYQDDESEYEPFDPDNQNSAADTQMSDSIADA